MEKLRALTDSFTVNAFDDVALRLYPDFRPHHLEIAPLQKGLVLALHGKELIEEGIGFGVPVVKYRDKTFFPGTAKVFLTNEDNGATLIKSFTLDTVSKKQIWKGPYINDRLYSALHKAFARAYLGHKKTKPVSEKIMQLRRTAKVHTQFVKVRPRAEINIRYKCLNRTIEIEAEVSKLDKAGCEEILILNEQGATFFQKYSDSDGMEFFDGQVGGWERVNASEASFSDIKGTLAFTLRNLDGASLFRGWERISNRFSWAGLSYSLKPKASSFAYTIELKQGQ